MSNLSLERIIEKSYNNVINGDLRKYCTKMSSLAGIILGDVYEVYEKNKQKTSHTDLKLFIESRDSIKHLIAILNKFITGVMTVNEAIVDQIKIIKNEEFAEKKVLLIDLITDEMNITKNEPNRIRNPEAIAQSIIDNLIKLRVEGKLHYDTEAALTTLDTKTVLISLIKKINSGEEIRDVMIDYYRILDESRRRTSERFIESINRLESNLPKLIQSEFDEVHVNISSMGKQIYSAVDGSKDNMKMVYVPPSPHLSHSSYPSHHSSFDPYYQHSPAPQSSQAHHKQVKNLPNDELFGRKTMAPQNRDSRDPDL